MSTLRANTIQDASGGNPMPVADINQGRAKVWICLDGTGTISVRDSFNVASIVDVGVGNYQVNFNVPHANVGFSGLGCSEAAATNVSGRANNKQNVNTLNTSLVAADFTVISLNTTGDQ